METTIAPQSKTIKLSNGEETPCLPEEIINEEILSRLPVKSLLRFRCVAKSWCSLIGSKKFIKKHLQRSTFTHHRIFFHSIEGFKSCSVPSLFNHPPTDSVTHYELGIDFERPKESIYIAGCCNGLVCLLLGRKRFILWNPTTKKFRKLPDFDRLKKHVSITKYGFGFDALTDDYKVFGVVSVSCVRGAHIAISKVYSLRTNSWTLIEGMEASSFDGAAMCVSGKLHWDWGIRYTYQREIASFDLNSLVYGVVELPDSLKGEFSHRLGLGVLKGCLSVHSFHQKTHVDVWLMKEYGVKESWEKVVTIPYYHDPRDYSVPTPVSIGPNGEVLLYYGEDFFIYNQKDNVFRHPHINGHAMFLDLGMYYESLASVVPCAEDQSNILG